MDNHRCNSDRICTILYNVLAPLPTSEPSPNEDSQNQSNNENSDKASPAYDFTVYDCEWNAVPSHPCKVRLPWPTSGQHGAATAFQKCPISSLPTTIIKTR